MGYKVRKGLNSPLKIWGMKQHYFYLWAGSSGACLLLLGLTFNSFIQQGLGGVGKFFGLCLLLALVSLIGKVYFSSKSSKKRISFGSGEVSISNKDILSIRRHYRYEKS